MLLGRLSLLVLSVVVLAVLIPYFTQRREVRTLDAAARSVLGGSYVALPSGITHYELGGPAEGPVAVLIHGGTIPLFAWDAQVPALHQAGFRVLRYDQLGRGYSDRPRVDYDRSLYLSQLEELLAALPIEGPVNLVGVSFGGGLAATFAEAHPDRVLKLVLIAPVVDYAEGRALFGLAKVPILSDWFARVFTVRATVARATGFFDASGADPSYATRFDEQTRFEGFERALLSMSRTDALSSYRETYAALGHLPTLLLWGTSDAEIPRAHMELIESELEAVTFVEIEGAGHGVATERKDQVNREIVGFLGRKAE